MKLSRPVRILMVGGFFAIVFFMLIVAVVFVRCLIAGIAFNFEAIWPTAFKNSIFIGIVAILLTAVGGLGHGRSIEILFATSTRHHHVAGERRVQLVCRTIRTTCITTHLPPRTRKRHDTAPRKLFRQGSTKKADNTIAPAGEQEVAGGLFARAGQGRAHEPLPCRRGIGLDEARQGEDAAGDGAHAQKRYESATR